MEIFAEKQRETWKKVYFTASTNKAAAVLGKKVKALGLPFNIGGYI